MTEAGLRGGWRNATASKQRGSASGSRSWKRILPGVAALVLFVPIGCGGDADHSGTANRSSRQHPSDTTDVRQGKRRSDFSGQDNAAAGGAEGRSGPASRRDKKARQALPGQNSETPAQRKTLPTTGRAPGQERTNAGSKQTPINPEAIPGQVEP